MLANNVGFNALIFRVLSDKKIEALHLATLEIPERTGVTFDSEEAIQLFGDHSADVSDNGRVKAPLIYG